MIAYLEGKVLYKTNDYLILSVNGVGYKINTKTEKIKVNQKEEFFIYHYTDSNNQEALYGFRKPEALRLFEEFLKAPGIGPRTTQRIIESDKLSNIREAILNENITFFTRVKGVGKKSAQKIILELKNSLADLEGKKSEKQSSINEALQSLGFSKKEIARALNKVKVDKFTEEKALEKLLQELG